MVGAVSNGSTGYNFDNNQFNNYIINLRDKVDTKFTNNTFYGSQTLNQIVLWPYGVGVAKTLIVENNHLNATDGALAWVSIVPFVNYVNGSGNFGEIAVYWPYGGFTALGCSGMVVRGNTVSGLTCNEALLATWDTLGHTIPKTYKTEGFGIVQASTTGSFVQNADDLVIGDMVVKSSTCGPFNGQAWVTLTPNVGTAGAKFQIVWQGIGALNPVAQFSATTTAK